MCGRYTLFTPQGVLEDRFDAAFERPTEPRYNCAPGQRLPVIANDAPDAIRFRKWGLVPSWADDESDGGFINARAETVREKRSFREPFERRRCLVLADGFYEWVERDGGGKQPYRVAFEDDRPFAMAGLWERWTPPTTQTGLSDFGGGGGGSGGSGGSGANGGDGAGGPAGTQAAEGAEPDAVETFAVVTTEPNGLISDLHDRMAVVLAPDEEREWLTADPDDAAALLDPHPDDEMIAYPVSTRVNSPANDAPDLIEPIEG
ncbi:SOS response-associated peptidase [Halegenticoccus soli]|uniref:SOS response-associated peptidase n=1 Tax=Halegenticoccus soli TaxID=1985678 RepID=UPI000C6D017D|nr:SOS response-associated peptidase [Halegenticoccus soli]